MKPSAYLNQHGRIIIQKYRTVMSIDPEDIDNLIKDLKRVQAKVNNE